MVRRPDPAFWAGRPVLLTGQTGFKGAWAARMLAALGARVTGYALDPAPGPSAFDLMSVGRGLDIAQRLVTADEVGPIEDLQIREPVVAVLRNEELLRFDDARASQLREGDCLVYLHAHKETANDR